jgi:hypothetical protein
MHQGSRGTKSTGSRIRNTDLKHNKPRYLYKGLAYTQIINPLYPPVAGEPGPRREPGTYPTGGKGPAPSWEVVAEML